MFNLANIFIEHQKITPNDLYMKLRGFNEKHKSILSQNNYIQLH